MDALWTPSAERISASRITKFIAQVNEAKGLSLSGYDDLYEWSVQEPAAFWEQVWKAADVIASHSYEGVLENGDAMPGARWFPGSQLNFAENLMRRRDEHKAIVWRHENGKTQSITYKELASQVARLTMFLEDQGVMDGDVVAAYLPNRIEAVVTMLATSALGATFTSCSPDFGMQGVLDRFGQVEPKVLVTCDGYHYNGQRHDILKRLQEMLLELYTIERVVMVPTVHENPSRAGLRGALMWSEALDREIEEPYFEQFPFDHPLYVLYSSGTTGTPKCIVHGQGGTLLQHFKEHALHTDIGPNDVVFYYTTTGWMMWNWLASTLAVGATMVLYDGSPSFNNLDHLWKVAEDFGVTVFGTSPKFLGACAKAGMQPGGRFDLSKLKAVLSTGAPLSAELFEWVYNNVKGDLQLASISGGTDIVSCFMLGSPIDPVYAGEIQKRALGMAIEAWGPDGKPVVGDKGELVCTKPFPSMPVGFHEDWDGTRYRAAYFDHFPGVWRHGDFIEITERGGVIVHGRSDATLNPGGIRIGTAEIYRVVESMDEIGEALVIGQDWQGDTRVVLFVVLPPGQELSEGLRTSIKTRIRGQATPRHVPALILQVPELPRTRSGKKVEIAVTKVVHGDAVNNQSALANPKALQYFKGRPELR
jgi:acetoacetyl-CoA synthetase